MWKAYTGAYGRNNIVTSVPSKHHMIQYMADNKASVHRYSTHTFKCKFGSRLQRLVSRTIGTFTIPYMGRETHRLTKFCTFYSYSKKMHVSNIPPHPRGQRSREVVSYSIHPIYGPVEQHSNCRQSAQRTEVQSVFRVWKYSQSHGLKTDTCRAGNATEPLTMWADFHSSHDTSTAHYPHTTLSVLSISHVTLYIWMAIIGCSRTAYNVAYFGQNWAVKLWNWALKLWGGHFYSCEPPKELYEPLKWVLNLRTSVGKIWHTYLSTQVFGKSFFLNVCIYVHTCYRPVLEGAAELVGIDCQLETKVVAIFTGVREDLDHWVLSEHIPPL